MASFKAAALTSLLASAGLVSAQGFFYQEPFACSADQDHRYLGCAAVTSQPFGYNPTNPDGDYSRGYPGYAASGHVNSTVTPAGCTKACRGHGFKYAAMYDRGCRCGTSIDGLNPTTDETPCQTSTRPCPGDGGENCGSSSGARIYVDPSFQDYASIGDKVAGYGVLGCFYKPNLPTGLTSVSQTTVATAADCLNFCAASYYPFAYMAQNGGSINCKCGQDFGLNARAYDDTTDQVCQQKCSAAMGTKGCTGQDCCGDDGAQTYPVYANPDFMGCNVPRIPGFASKALDPVGDNMFTCIATPQSIVARATYTVPFAGKSTVTRSATFVATATAGAATYINFGCYPNAGPLDGSTPIAAAALPNNEVTVRNCIAACGSGSQVYDWVGLRGAVNGQTPACFCGTGKGTLGSSGDMEICNGPCDGSGNTENCGPENGLLAYAVSASATTGDWYTSYTSTYSVTHTYSCTPTDSSSSVSATTSSEAVSTTSSEAVSTTSSEAASTTSSANNDASTTSSANGDVSTTSSAVVGETTTSSVNDATSTGNADVSSTSTTNNDETSTTGSGSESTGGPASGDASSTSTANNEETSTTGSGSESTGGPASGDASSTEAGNTGASTDPGASNTSKPTTPATDNASATSSEGMQTTPDSTIAQTLSPPTNGPGGDSTTRKPSSTGQQGGDLTTLPGGASTSAGEGPSTGGQGPATSGGEGPATSGSPSTGGQGPATSGGASTGGQGPATSGGASSGGQGPATSAGDFSSPGSEPTSPGGVSSATPATRTSTSSGTASSTSDASKPTITLASLEVKRFSALFTGEVPVAAGAFVPLIIYDENGNPTQQSYVVELLGCFLVPDGKVPFTGRVADFKGNEKAGGSASSCAGFCAGTGLKLSANNGGVCYCGDQVEVQNLQNQDLKSCSTPCPDGSGEICGGGDKFQKRWLSRRANTFATIIVAVPANNVVLVNKDGGAVSDVPFLSMSYPPVSVSASGGVGSTSATGSGSVSIAGPSDSNAPTGSMTTGGPGASNVPSGSATDGGNVPGGSMTTGGPGASSVPSGSATDGGNVPGGSMTTGPSASNAPSGSATDGGNVPSGSMTGPNGSNVPSGSMTAGPSGSATTGPGGAGSTGPGASATNSAGLPGVTDLPQTPVLLSVIPGLVNVTNKKRDFAEMYRRQSLGGFIGAAGPINPTSCSDATPFNLTQGRLVSGGQFVATEPNVPFIELKVVPAGSISTTFTVVNGVLFWYNAAFVGGQAGFCQVASGQVYATFGAPGTGPANCNTISIVVYQASQCQNGALSTAIPPIGGPGGAGGPAATGTATGTGGAGSNGGSPSSGGVPSSSGIYRLTESPAGGICVTTTLAFVPGAPTFVPLA